MLCYRCKRPASMESRVCETCGLALDWGAIGDLRSLDYLKLRLEQWRRQGVVDEPLADRLRDEVARNHATLLEALGRGWPPAPKPRPAPAAPPGPRRLKPRYTLGETETAGPPPFRPAPVGTPPRFERPVEPPAPARRALLDVLVDFGTVRLMLYTGAILFAAGVLVWLRDMLRFQLQRPQVQAGLLGLVTFTALAGGVALVLRARERDEQKLIGRGVLLIGTLLLPLNPWFWVQTGLVVSSGNAWTVTLLTFAVSLAIALGLGDRVFVYMSYVMALLTGWMLTLKVTGGAAPGAYALVLALISGAYLHAELPIARVAERRGWEKLGNAFFICGHIGVAITLVFYTSVVRHLPAELIAAFRHFDASGYTPWVGVAVALLAAQAYLYSAWRRGDSRFTYIGAGAALWAAALSLFAWHAPRGAWMAACGTASLVAYLLGRAFAREPLWGPPLARVSAVFGWIGVAVAIGVGVAFAAGVELRWFTALGVALLAARFALALAETDEPANALPIPGLALLLAAYVLRAAGTPWVYVDAMLAAMLAAAPFAAAMLPPSLSESRKVLGRVSTALCFLLAIPAIHFAIAATPSTAHRPALLAAALAVAFATNGWMAETAPLRYILYALSGLAIETAAILGLVNLRARLDVQSRLATFFLVPLAFAHLAAWLATKRAGGERAAEVGAVARVWASLAAGVAAATALPLLVDGAFNERALFLFAFALALAAAAPLAAAAIERDTAWATIEGAYGLLLALGVYAGATFGIVERVETGGPRALVGFSLLGAAPLLLALVERLLTRRAPAIAGPACAIGGGLALLSMLVLIELTLPSWADPAAFQPLDRLAFVTLALLLAAYGVRSVLAYNGEPWRVLWTVQAATATTLAAHGTLRLAVPVAMAALVMEALAAALLVAGGRAARSGERIAAPMLAMAHGLAAVSLANAIAAEPAGQPVGWRLVAVFAALVVCYALGAVAAERTSLLDRAHRLLAAVAAFATASAALHAAGYTTATAQFEPLVALLTLAMMAAVLAPRSWSSETGVYLLHLLMVGLVVVAAVDPMDSTPWTAARVARFAGFACAFSLTATLRRSALSAASAIAWACIALGAVLEHVDAPAAGRVIAFAVAGAALALVATRLGERFDWLRATLAVAGNGIFGFAAAAEMAFAARELEVGNVALGLHAVAFAVVAGLAWLLHRVLGEAGAPYRIAFRVYASATYVLLGLRLGFHPWRDSAFYTAPVGAFLVGLGAWASRRDEEAGGAAPLLWLGSLLAAGPMLLHALDNRFVQEISPVGYDIGTLSVGLGLALVGLLFQLRAPSLVAATVLTADLFVIAFGQIRWNQLTLALFAILIGGLLIAVSWLILYRRDDLYRMRDFVRERRELFRRWK